MPDTADIVKLRKQLLPTGRAFRVPEGGAFEKMLQGLSGEAAVALSEAEGLLNSVIPDNDQFSVADAVRWEFALSISGDENASIVNRRLAIYRKMQFPANVKGRQHKYYLMHQLQSAGFNCRIWEWAEVKNFGESIVHSLETEHAMSTMHGFVGYPDFSQVVSRYIDYNMEEDVPTTIENLQNVFWITASSGFENWLNVTKHRIEEFRNIILTIKPLHTVAFLRITMNDAWVLESGLWDMGGVWLDDGIWKH